MSASAQSLLAVSEAITAIRIRDGAFVETLKAEFDTTLTAFIADLEAADILALEKIQGAVKKTIQKKDSQHQQSRKEARDKAIRVALTECAKGDIVSLVQKFGDGTATEEFTDFKSRIDQIQSKIVREVGERFDAATAELDKTFDATRKSVIEELDDITGKFTRNRQNIVDKLRSRDERMIMIVRNADAGTIDSLAKALIYATRKENFEANSIDVTITETLQKRALKRDAGIQEYKMKRAIKFASIKRTEEKSNQTLILQSSGQTDSSSDSE